jgi:hypothetical protein
VIYLYFGVDKDEMCKEGKSILLNSEPLIVVFHSNVELRSLLSPVLAFEGSDETLNSSLSRDILYFFPNLFRIIRPIDLYSEVLLYGGINTLVCSGSIYGESTRPESTEAVLTASCLPKVESEWLVKDYQIFADPEDRLY